MLNKECECSTTNNNNNLKFWNENYRTSSTNSNVSSLSEISSLQSRSLKISADEELYDLDLPPKMPLISVIFKFIIKINHR